MKGDTPEQGTREASDAGPSRSHARLILAVIIAAVFLDVIDFSVVQVALPTIQREFRVEYAESQWIIGAYGLTLAGFLMVSGRAGDLYGHKRVFVIGIGAFTLSYLTGGVDTLLTALSVPRGVEGIAAPLMTGT